MGDSNESSRLFQCLMRRAFRLGDIDIMNWACVMLWKSNGAAVGAMDGTLHSSKGSCLALKCLLDSILEHGLVPSRWPLLSIGLTVHRGLSSMKPDEQLKQLLSFVAMMMPGPRYNMRWPVTVSITRAAQLEEEKQEPNGGDEFVEQHAEQSAVFYERMAALSRAMTLVSPLAKTETTMEVFIALERALLHMPRPFHSRESIHQFLDLWPNMNAMCTRPLHNSAILSCLRAFKEEWLRNEEGSVYTGRLLLYAALLGQLHFDQMPSPRSSAQLTDEQVHDIVRRCNGAHPNDLAALAMQVQQEEADRMPPKDIKQLCQRVWGTEQVECHEEDVVIVVQDETKAKLASSFVVEEAGQDFLGSQWVNMKQEAWQIYVSNPATWICPFHLSPKSPAADTDHPSSSALATVTRKQRKRSSQLSVVALEREGSSNAKRAKKLVTFQPPHGRFMGQLVTNNKTILYAKRPTEVTFSSAAPVPPTYIVQIPGLPFDYIGRSRRRRRRKSDDGDGSSSNTEPIPDQRLQQQRWIVKCGDTPSYFDFALRMDNMKNLFGLRPCNQQKVSWFQDDVQYFGMACPDLAMPSAQMQLEEIKDAEGITVRKCLPALQLTYHLAGVLQSETLFDELIQILLFRAICSVAHTHLNHILVVPRLLPKLPVRDPLPSHQLVSIGETCSRASHSVCNRPQHVYGQHEVEEELAAIIKKKKSHIVKLEDDEDHDTGQSPLGQMLLPSRDSSHNAHVWQQIERIILSRRDVYLQLLQKWDTDVDKQRILSVHERSRLSHLVSLFTTFH